MDAPFWSQGACAESGAVDVSGSCARRLEGRRSGLVEWYENGPAGLEHGFLVPADPGGETLVFDVAIAGAKVVADGDEATLLPDNGGRPLSYAGLVATDADGAALPASMREADGGLRIEVDTAGARWPVTVDPIITDRWYQTPDYEYSSTYGRALAAGDIDGDGFPDAFIGDSGDDVVYGFKGSAFGLALEPSWTISVSGVSNLGASLAFLGDVNGDGYGDLAAGASGGAGKVLVFHGGETGPSTTAASWTATGTESGQSFGAAIAAAGDTNGDGYADLLVGSYTYDGGRTDQGLAAVYLGSASGLSASAAWSATSGQSNAYYGYSVAGAGDVDGDGYDDIVVGAYTYDDGETNEGEAWLYSGSASGPSTSASWSWDSDEASAGGGYAVAGAGDVDGDGYADVFVSAPYDDSAGHSDAGVVHLFRGSAGGLGTTPTTSVQGDSAEVEIGRLLLGGADVDDDGHPDLVANWGTRLHSWLATGGTLSTTEDSEWVGALLGASADFDGDGHEDLLWGYAAYYSTYIYVYPGTGSGLDEDPMYADWAVVGYTTSLGYYVGDGGDYNGDGYGDVLAGTTSYTYPLAGSATGISTASTARYGSVALGTIGDVDSDGYEDVFLGGSSSSTVYYGSAAGLVDSLSLGSAANAVTAGDYNADGYADFAAGRSTASYFDIRYSTASGITAASYTRVSGSYDSLGGSLATGDFNADGYDDLAAGAAGGDVTFGNEGKAVVYYGSAAGLSTSAGTTTIGGGQASAGCYGVSAGDVDGDGYDDLVYSCPSWTEGAASVGKVSLFLGSASGLTTSASWSWVGTDASDEAGDYVAVADFTGDGYADVAVLVPGDDYGADDTGLVQVFRGSAAGLPDEPDITFVGHYLGWGSNNSIAAVRSVDGDGTPDLAWGVPLNASYGGAGVWVYDLDDDDGDGEPRVVDCDDDDATIWSGGVEVENGRDDDCDGVIDNVIPVWYLDDDGDGYGDPATGISSETAISGRTRDGGDCDDTDPAISPAATEYCNGHDDDCDGDADEPGTPDGTIFYADADGDGHGGTAEIVACSLTDGAATSADDCDDADPGVSPDASESCDGIDDDCDGETDEDTAVDAGIWHPDADADGYGAFVSTRACSAPAGYIATDGDCDDADASISPRGTESCDGVDEDCDGTVDDGVSTPWWADTDGDSYGDPGARVDACSPPGSGYVENAEDCDDTRSSVSPAGIETCDGLDGDCDGTVDEGVESTFYGDADGDGHGVPAVTMTGCYASEGYVALSDDCDDAVATTFPGAPELCDRLDQDCDGLIDEDAALTTWYADTDGDGYGDPAVEVTECTAPDGYVASDTDCDDASPASHPGAHEIWYDGRDEDCDGGSDFDQDGDGQDAVSAGTDCDDTNPAAYDGADEIWYDGVDEDCAGGDDDDRDGDGHASDAHGGDDCDDTDPDVVSCGSEEDPEGDDDKPVGCGCSTGDRTDASALGLVALGAALVARRRRLPE